MSDPITMQLTDNANEILARLHGFKPVLLASLMRSLDYQNELTVGHIQADYLSRRGPDTLGVVTNRLRSSIRRTEAVVSGDSITSSIGSNVEYAGVHEFGFDGMVTVRPFTRRVASRDSIRVGPRGGKKKIAEGISFVRGFQRHMVVKERAPIRRGIADRTENYREGLSQAVIDAWGKGA